MVGKRVRGGKGNRVSEAERNSEERRVRRSGEWGVES